MPRDPTDKRQHFVLDGVDWRTYSRLLRMFEERRSLRLTYDRGRLELMSPPCGRISEGRLLCRFVNTLTEELGLGVHGGGSTTLRLNRKRRGLEPDECFWIANEFRMRGKRELDLRTDPPPDLAIEVEGTHSTLDRLAIYAALGVPEVWRFDGESLTFHGLAQDGRYTTLPASPTLGSVTPGEIAIFLAMWEHEENSVVRQLRDWIRQRPRG